MYISGCMLFSAQKKTIENRPMSTMHLITFHTQGGDIDNGIDLSETANRFKQLYEPHLDYYEAFNTEKMCNIIPDFKSRYLQSVSASGEHRRGCNIGFWAWKPAVILNYMKGMKDGDILVYHDCNISRYADRYSHDTANFKNNVEYLFAITGLDLIVPFENPNDNEFICENYVKKDAIQQIGEYTDYYRKFPLLHANRIFIRKNKSTEAFILNWHNLCETDLILPEDYPMMYGSKQTWHTHDQAILSILYRKYIDMGYFPENAPNIYFKDSLFSRNNILQVSSTKPKPKTNRMSMKFM